MKVHLLDTDPRQVTDKENYALNHGSFSEVMINMNKALQKIGHYAPPDEADFVGICDGMRVNFQYKDKPSFVINVWETLNTIPYLLLQYSLGQNIFGLSNQITNLWRKYGVQAKTVYGGCDTEFWQQTLPKSEKFTFLHVNSSNVRSGIDLSLLAFLTAFKGNKNVRLIIKDTNNSEILRHLIATGSKEWNVEVQYISARMPATAIRDLYSSSHVCLNLLRSTSFGMPLLECSACNCLCVTGDIAPTNELIRPEYGVLVPSNGVIDIPNFVVSLSNNWGLLDCFPALECPETPVFASYDLETYSKLLKNIYTNWADFSKIDTRTPIVQNWKWETQAQKLVGYLNEIQLAFK